VSPLFGCRSQGRSDHAGILIHMDEPRSGVRGKLTRAASHLNLYHLPLADKDHTIHPLWVLNRLENVDKHRRLALTTGVGFESCVQIRDAAGGESTVLANERLHDGDVVARYSTPGEGHAGVEVDGAVLAFVALNEPHEFLALVGVVSVLKQILRYLSDHVLLALKSDVNTRVSFTDHTSSDRVDAHAGKDRHARRAASLRGTLRRRNKTDLAEHFAQLRS